VAAGGECGEALRESERQFQQSFGHAPCGMIATSLKAGQPSSPGQRCASLSGNWRSPAVCRASGS
jgi:hypothetical protein